LIFAAANRLANGLLDPWVGIVPLTSVLHRDELDDAVLNMAERVAKVPIDVQQMNKRSLHKQMEVMGIRTGIRLGAEMNALARNTESCQAQIASLRENVKASFTERDAAFGSDYTTKKKA